MNKDINWFKLNRSLHRDIGYFCIGLTLIFAVSGIALNHLDDWNPNYQVTQETHLIPDINSVINQENFESWLLRKLNIKTKVKARFWQTPTEYKLFTTDNHSLLINAQNNSVVVEQVKARFLLKSLNTLHLNDSLLLSTNNPIIKIDTSKISFVDKDTIKVKYQLIKNKANQIYISFDKNSISSRFCIFFNLDKNEKLWIAVPVEHFVGKFDIETEEEIFSISGKELEPTIFEYPEYITAINDFIYVSDMGNRRIVKINIHNYEIIDYKKVNEPIFYFNQLNGKNIYRFKSGIYFE